MTSTAKKYYEAVEKIQTWNFDTESCPDHLTVALMDSGERYYIGTLYHQDDGLQYRGECYKGDPDVFYRMNIVAWRSITPEDLGRNDWRQRIG